VYNPKQVPQYKFNEDLILSRLEQYVNNTYNQHYATTGKQTTEIVFEHGHGDGFCIGNIIKYAQRFGKKEGRNEQDLYKVIHYALILLGKMHEETLEDLNEYNLELNDGS
jgi:hypothetical protein